MDRFLDLDSSVKKAFARPIKITLKLALWLTSPGLILFGTGSASAQPYAIARIESAESAKCLPRETEGPSATLDLHEIQLVYGQRDSSNRLASILMEVDRLSENPIPSLKHFAMEIEENYRITGTEVMDLELNMPKIIIKEPDNTALIAHEMVSAYFTAPWIFNKSGPACRQAYHFFRTQVFTKGEPVCLVKIVAHEKPKSATQAAKPLSKI
jgi:hypothetical protein